MSLASLYKIQHTAALAIVLVRMAQSVLVCGDWGFPTAGVGSALCFRHPTCSMPVGGMPVRVLRVIPESEGPG